MTKDERLAAFKTDEYQLVSAVENSDLSKVKELLQKGIGVSVHEPVYQRTVLHVAADNGSTKFVSFLISAGAELNALDGNAMTPLMCACSKGKKKGSDAALLLIDAGADVRYIRTEDGMSAIKFAMWGQCSNAVLEKLIAFGAEAPPSDFRVIRLV